MISSLVLYLNLSSGVIIIIGIIIIQISTRGQHSQLFFVVLENISIGHSAPFSPFTDCKRRPDMMVSDIMHMPLSAWKLPIPGVAKYY